MRYVALFFLLVSLFGLACCGISLALSTSWHHTVMMLILTALTVRNIVSNLHDVVVLILERRRDDQLTWAIRFALRSVAPGLRVTEQSIRDIVTRRRARLRLVS